MIPSPKPKSATTLMTNDNAYLEQLGNRPVRHCLSKGMSGLQIVLATEIGCPMPQEAFCEISMNQNYNYLDRQEEYTLYMGGAKSFQESTTGEGFEEGARDVMKTLVIAHDRLLQSGRLKNPMNEVDSIRTMMRKSEKLAESRRLKRMFPFMQFASTFVGKDVPIGLHALANLLYTQMLYTISNPRISVVCNDIDKALLSTAKTFRCAYADSEFLQSIDTALSDQNTRTDALGAVAVFHQVVSGVKCNPRLLVDPFLKGVFGKLEVESHSDTASSHKGPTDNAKVPARREHHHYALQLLLGTRYRKEAVTFVGRTLVQQSKLKSLPDANHTAVSGNLDGISDSNLPTPEQSDEAHNEVQDINNTKLRSPSHIAGDFKRHLLKMMKA